MLDKALHSGLVRSGISSFVQVGVEIEPVYLDASLRNNPELWAEESLAVESLSLRFWLGELILGVFFDVDNGEEATRGGPADTYTLEIKLLHSADGFELAERAADAAAAAAAAIARAFKDKLFDSESRVWEQIELRFCEAISETVLTYQEFKQLKRWRLDHLSLVAEPQLPVQAE